MITPINNIGNKTFVSNLSNKKYDKQPMARQLKSDSVSFTSQSAFINKSLLNMLNKLDKDAPVLGFKGDGKWLLPNLSKGVGKKYNLYMADGSQLSYHKSDWGDNVLFSFKQHKIDEKIPSKIKLKDVDDHLEFKKLQRTKANDVIAFRVNTKDATRYGQTYKAGEVTKIVKDEEGSIIEFAELSKDEFGKIHKLLEKYLPYFF